MRCSHCETENPSSVKFCKSCGTAMAAPVVTTAAAAASTAGCSCPACQHENLPSAKFCAKCGSKLNAATAAFVAVAETIVAADPIREVIATVSAPAFSSVPVSSSPSHPQQNAMSDQLVPPRAGSGIKIAIAAVIVAVIAVSGWLILKPKTEAVQIATPAVEQIKDAAAPLSNAPAAALVPERTPAIAPPTPPKSSSASVSSDEPAVGAEQKNTPLNAEEVKAKKAQLQAKKEADEQARIKKAEAIRAEHQARAQARADAQRSVTATPTARPASLVDQVEACKRQSFFEKEKCMWSLCHDRWGRDGCPSYN